MLSLVEDIVDKIRTSDVSAQFHHLSNFYTKLQEEAESYVQKEKSKKKPVSQKRTLSGRVVRQRVGPNGIEKREQDSSPLLEKNKTSRATSLNPLRIPVNLLNFKQTKSTLIAGKEKHHS